MANHKRIGDAEFPKPRSDVVLQIENVCVVGERKRGRVVHAEDGPHWAHTNHCRAHHSLQNDVICVPERCLCAQGPPTAVSPHSGRRPLGLRWQRTPTRAAVRRPPTAPTRAAAFTSSLTSVLRTEPTWPQTNRCLNPLSGEMPTRAAAVTNHCLNPLSGEAPTLGAVVVLVEHPHERMLVCE